MHPQINRPTVVTARVPGAEWLLLLGTEIVSIWILLRVRCRLGAPATAVLAYAWSPLVVIEGVQVGHVDLAQ
jgi:hypothetical protein